MNFLKKIVVFLVLILIIANAYKCSTIKKTQKNAPFEIGMAYYQNWIAGIKGAGSGMNLYIPIISNYENINLDSVYFQGKVAKLEAINDLLFIGRFETSANQPIDVNMSIDPLEEYGNQVKGPTTNFPFELEENQCVISYKEGDKIKYLIIEGVIKRKLQAFPSAPQKNQ